MARYRSLPTSLFKDPDVMALQTGDTRLILIGLVLNADDEGRGLAHAKLLGRELDYPTEQIEAALIEIEANELLTCYQAGRHRYYQLTRWQEWQTLSKPTPSRYPAPPGISGERTETGTTFPEIPQNPQGNLGKCREIPAEGEGEQEGEQKRTEREGEEEGNLPPNVVHFPVTSSTSTPLDPRSIRLSQATEKVAQILHLPVTAALSRTIEEFLDDPTISLLGEADAAWEYISSPKRNKNRQSMSNAFFRRWLRREREDYQKRHAIPSGGSPGREASSAHHPSSAEEDPYKVYLAKRKQQLAAAGGQ